MKLFQKQEIRYNKSKNRNRQEQSLFETQLIA